MNTKPQFLETDLLFRAFEDACNGLPFEISKPEEKYIGKILEFKDYNNDSKNIANKAIRTFLKEQSDPKSFRDNNHLAFKKLGRIFQVVSMFPEIDIVLPKVFVWEDDESYYLYQVKRVVGTVKGDYLIRYQPDAGNLRDQYFYKAPVQALWFEVDEPKRFDRKDFVLKWIAFHKTNEKSFSPLQRELENSILALKGINFEQFNPSSLFDMTHQTVDYVWSKGGHECDYEEDLISLLPTDAYKLVKSFIGLCRSNKEIEEQFSGKKSQFKSELLNLNINNYWKPLR